jgi:hypothetical protein
MPAFHCMAASCGGIVHRGMQGPTSCHAEPTVAGLPSPPSPGFGTPPTAAPPEGAAVVAGCGAQVIQHWLAEADEVGKIESSFVGYAARPASWVS